MIGKKLILVVLALAFFSSAPLLAGNGKGKGGPGRSSIDSDLSKLETADLVFMREEEKMARDVYEELYAFYKARDVELLIFARISSSEQNHMDAMLKLLNNYGLEDPAAGNSRGVFDNATLQALYLNLVSNDTDNEQVLNEPLEGGKTSPSSALYVGAWIEERDMLDIMQAISNTKKTDIVQVYTNLLCGSRRHLRAFVRQIGVADYEPQILLAPEDVESDTSPETTLEYWLGAVSDEICG